MTGRNFTLNQTQNGLKNGEGGREIDASDCRTSPPAAGVTRFNDGATKERTISVVPEGILTAVLLLAFVSPNT